MEEPRKRRPRVQRHTLQRLKRRPVQIPAGAKVTAEHDDGQLVVRIEHPPDDPQSDSVDIDLPSSL
jgi:hypothetical protein